MIRIGYVNATIPLILVLAATSGCDERVVEVAREAADRQAAQNQQMGDLQTEVARGTRSLVEADAAARQELVGVHRELQERTPAARRRLERPRNPASAIGEATTDRLGCCLWLAPSEHLHSSPC